MRQTINQHKYNSLQAIIQFIIMEHVMNQLSIEKQILIATLLSEGNSIRSISRITGVHKCTITSLGVRLGEMAMKILDERMRNLTYKNIQCDEIWCFVGKKKKNLTHSERKEHELGDQWIYVALDADTKLVPYFSVGKRTSQHTYNFIEEIRARVKGLFQLSTDSYHGYYNAVDDTFNGKIDYAQLHKQYQNTIEGAKRYSPAQIIRVTKNVIFGNPDVNKICTSHVERQNLTMRMQMRRLTRLTNAFSKKLYNLQCAVALHFFHYNFMRVHQTLRVTPAMEAGITNTIWSWENLLGISKQKKVA